MPKKKLAVDQLKGLLDCAICLERYEEPKMLNCTHEYCKLCIEQLARFRDDGSAVITCPLRCSQETELKKDQTVDNLAASYNFKNLLDALEDDGQKDDRMVACSHFKKCKRKPVTSYCCGNIMCDSCYLKHSYCDNINNKKPILTNQNENNGKCNNKNQSNKNSTGKKINNKDNKNTKQNNNSSRNKENSSNENNRSINENNDSNNNISNSKNSSNSSSNNNNNNNNPNNVLHEKMTLGYNRTEGKLMIVCDKHRAFCSSVCQDNKLLCTYCEHRCAEHQKHNKTSIEKEVRLLRETLNIEFNVRERILKFKEATKEKIALMKDEFRAILRRQKEECARRYTEFLEKEEIRLMEEYDKKCEDHLWDEYDEALPTEYCESMLQKHDAELFLQREDIWNEIMDSSRFDFLGTTRVYLEETENFLGTSPMGDIKSRFSGCVGYHNVPQSTCIFKFEENEEVDDKEEDDESVEEDTKEFKLLDSLDVSLGLKLRGNNYFQKKLYQKAKGCYSKAIQFCPNGSPELAVFHQNRAAASEELGDEDESMEDCTDALHENPRYLKALQRRSRLFEKHGYLRDAFADAVLAKFLDDPANRHKYRDTEIGKALGRKQAKEFLEKRNNRCFWLAPSKRTFREVLNDDNHNFFRIEITTTDSEDLLYSKIMEDLDRDYYEDIISTCSEVIKLDGKHKYRSHLLRGTLSLCKQDTDQARADFDEIIENMEEDEEVQIENQHLRNAAKIKRACLKLCIGDKSGFDIDFMCMLRFLSMSDKDKASMHYNIANFGVYFMTADKLMDHCQKAISLDGTFIAPRMRLGDILHYVAAGTNDLSTMQHAEDVCREMVRLFPEDYRSWNKYGQFLWKNKRYDEALEMTEKAISLGPGWSLPYIYKARILLDQQDIKGAAELCEKALEIDKECYEALGFYGKVKMAMKEYGEAAALLEKSIEGSFRTIDFLCNIFRSLEENRVRARILEEHMGHGEFD